MRSSVTSGAAEPRSEAKSQDDAGDGPVDGGDAPDYDGGNGPDDSAVNFVVTVTNTAQYLSATPFARRVGLNADGPLTAAGMSYQVQFQAAPGARLSLATMAAQTNDWFYAAGEDGLALFDEDGTPLTGDVTDRVRLYDAGTEEEEFTVGEPEPGNGLARLAEVGMPGELADYLNATGSSGAPLRLSAALTPFSPGVVYTFADGTGDPLFVQGEEALEASGLEALAEDGTPQGIVSYFEQAGINHAESVDGGPAVPGGAMTFEISARPGDRLGFATMFVQSNDWFAAFNNNGVAWFDEDDTPEDDVDFSAEAYLFDAGTEVDETVGLGDNQALRQVAPNTGEADEDPATRRVSLLEDLLFGKGDIESGPGVVAPEDERGGYNLLKVTVRVK